MLSYKFTQEIPQGESKKVPNSFEDQMSYKKTFHYLIVNECIADIHNRLIKISEKKGSMPIPIKIGNFKKKHDGFVQF